MGLLPKSDFGRFGIAVLLGSTVFLRKLNDPRFAVRLRRNQRFPLSRNLGFAEPHPKRSWFVVERFSAVVVPLRNILKSALKRSTTDLTRGRFMVPMRARKEWRLSMNLPPHLYPLPRSGGEEMCKSHRGIEKQSPLPLGERAG